MSEPVPDSVHEKLAKTLFNKTWDSLDMEQRSPMEDVEMIHTAHASRYHWGIVGKPIQFERGEWLISRVYAVLEMPESALYHARKSLDICLENNIGDFDIAFAYEAIARAYHLAGDEDQYKVFYEKASEAGQKIEDEGNRDYFLGELGTA